MSSSVPAEVELDAAERAAILEDWARLAAEPRPAPRPPYGCATFLIALALFLLIPQLPRVTGWDLPPALRTTVLVILGLAIAGGLFFSFALASSKFHHDSARAHESIEWLAAHPDTSDAAARRRSAVSLLYYSVISDDGPSTSGTFDVDRARQRLGAHLPYVIAVERFLAAERGLWKAFSE